MHGYASHGVSEDDVVGRVSLAVAVAAARVDENPPLGPILDLDQLVRTCQRLNRGQVGFSQAGKKDAILKESPKLTEIEQSPNQPID